MLGVTQLRPGPQVGHTCSNPSPLCFRCSSLFWFYLFFSQHKQSFQIQPRIISFSIRHIYFANIYFYIKPCSSCSPLPSVPSTDGPKHMLGNHIEYMRNPHNSPSVLAFPLWVSLSHGNTGNGDLDKTAGLRSHSCTSVTEQERKVKCSVSRSYDLNH